MNVCHFSGHPSLVEGFKQSIAAINEIVAAALTSEPSLEKPKDNEETSLPLVRCDADINKSTFRERFIRMLTTFPNLILMPISSTSYVCPYSTA